MGLIWNIIKALANSSESNIDNNDVNRECDMIGLNKEEREQVKLGNQDPWDFEYDGKEETDYYKDANK